jgi:hypothetical protein
MTSNLSWQFDFIAHYEMFLYTTGPQGILFILPHDTCNIAKSREDVNL